MVGRLLKTKKEISITAARFGTNGLRKDKESYSDQNGVSMYRESTYGDCDQELNEDSGFAATMPRVLDRTQAENVLRQAFRKVRAHKSITPKSLKAEIKALESQVAALEKKVRSLQKNMKALDSTKEPRRERKPSYLTKGGGNIRVTNNHAGRVAQKKRALLKEIDEIKGEIRPLQELLDVKRDEFARIKPGSVGWFGESWRKEGATTAACAVVTPNEVAVRSAGDSVVLAIGRNGKVVILNNLHQSGPGQGIDHCLVPQQNLAYAERQDDKHVYDKHDIMSFLSENDPNDVRILVATDGVYGILHQQNNIMMLMEDVVGGLDFDDPNYAQKFVEKTIAELKSRNLSTGKSIFKADDITVASTKILDEKTVCLGAFDGVGGDGPQSAVVSALAAESMECAVEEVMEDLLKQEREQQNIKALAEEHESVGDIVIPIKGSPHMVIML